MNEVMHIFHRQLCYVFNVLCIYASNMKEMLDPKKYEGNENKNRNNAGPDATA